MKRVGKQSSRSAKLVYKPVGLAGSMLAGLLAGQVVKQVWKQASPRHTDDPPKPLESEYPLREIIMAAALQGAVFAVVKAIVDRGGARAFERWTGEWPGD